MLCVPAHATTSMGSPPKGSPPTDIDDDIRTAATLRIVGSSCVPRPSQQRLTVPEQLPGSPPRGKRPHLEPGDDEIRTVFTLRVPKTTQQHLTVPAPAATSIGKPIESWRPSVYRGVQWRS